jgi:hypothetical protein
VALFRLVFGIVMLYQSLSLALNLGRYYGPQGVLPFATLARLHPPSRYSLFALAPENELLPFVLCGLLLLCGLAYLVGLVPRAAALVFFVLWLSFQQRNPLVVNSGDWLIGMLAALSACMPLARRARLPSGPSDPLPSLVSNWGRRLIQLQLCYIYWYAFLAKLGSARWREGLALRDVLSSPLYAEWPGYLHPLLAMPLSYSSLLFEGLFPILVWKSKWRTRALLAGVVFHLGIEIFLKIPAFSVAMLSGYALFLRDAEAEAVLERLSRLALPWRAKAAAPTPAGEVNGAAGF